MNFIRDILRYPTEEAALLKLRVSDCVLLVGSGTQCVVVRQNDTHMVTELGTMYLYNDIECIYNGCMAWIL